MTIGDSMKLMWRYVKGYNSELPLWNLKTCFGQEVFCFKNCALNAIGMDYRESQKKIMSYSAS